MNYDDIYQRAKVIADYLRVEENEINLETDLVEDLCTDSIALVELGLSFQKFFNSHDGYWQNHLCKNIVVFVKDNIKSKIV